MTTPTSPAEAGYPDTPAVELKSSKRPMVTRRAALASIGMIVPAVGLAASGLAGGATAMQAVPADIDPIYQAIDRYRLACAQYNQAASAAEGADTKEATDPPAAWWHAGMDAEGITGPAAYVAAERAVAMASENEEAAFTALIETCPTTLAGVIALLEYFAAGEALSLPEDVEESGYLYGMLAVALRNMALAAWRCPDGFVPVVVRDSGELYFCPARDVLAARPKVRATYTVTDPTTVFDIGDAGRGVRS